MSCLCYRINGSWFGVLRRVGCIGALFVLSPRASRDKLDGTRVSRQTTNHFLKGNCHELRMHLSKFVCGNMPGFLTTESTCSFVWSYLFRRQRPSYEGGFALHRCRLESNLKSSGCLFQVKLLMIVSL